MRHVVLQLAAAADVWKPPTGAVERLAGLGTSGRVRLAPGYHAPMAGAESLALLGYRTDRGYIDLDAMDGLLAGDEWPAGVRRPEPFLRRTGMRGAVLAGDPRTQAIGLALGLAVFALEDPWPDLQRALEDRDLVLAHLPVLGARPLLEALSAEVIEPLVERLEAGADLRVLVAATDPSFAPMPYAMAGTGIAVAPAAAAVLEPGAELFARFVQSFNV